jgi:hypothetical protein
MQRQAFAPIGRAEPAARFSRLKDEQREWLKQLVAAPTLTDKSKLMQQRIKVLQDLHWQD